MTVMQLKVHIRGVLWSFSIVEGNSLAPSIDSCLLIGKIALNTTALPLQMADEKGENLCTLFLCDPSF